MPFTLPPAYTFAVTETNNVGTPVNFDSTGLSDDSADPNARLVRLQTILNRVISQNQQAGVQTAVSVIDLSSTQAIKQYNIDEPQFAASVNKLPIARLILNDLTAGRLQNDQVLTWKASDVRAGAGKYDQPDAPKRATVRQLLFDMLNPSGNTAVRVLVNQGMGGAQTVNRRFGNELHLQQTRLQPQGGDTFYVGNTTAREAMANIRGLLSGNDANTKFVKNALATNIYTDYGVRTQLAGNDYTVLANKVGILDDPEGNNRHDVGIIYNQNTGKSYAYAFLNTAQGPGYNQPTSQATVSLADMGRGVLRYSGDTLQKSETAFNSTPSRIDSKTLY